MHTAQIKQIYQKGSQGKTIFTNALLKLIIIASTLYSGEILAKGVFAGAEISNKVIVTYSIAGEAQTPVESSPEGNGSPGIGNGKETIFKVDRKIDLTVTNNGDTNVTVGETLAELNFTLTNDGNDNQEFLLTADSTIAGDNFDAQNCKINTNSVTGSPLPGVVLPALDIIKLKPDQQANISVKCDIPFDNNGQAILVNHRSLLSLKALASKNSDGSVTTQEITPDSTNNIDTVFADTAGTDDEERDAKHSDQASYITLTGTAPPPALNINKAIVSVVDPQGGNQSISGSNVTYKIAITTSGKGVINNVVITDQTPVGMTYKASSILLDNTVLTDASDTDNADFNGTTNIATINLGNINAGDQHEIQLTFTIN